MLSVNGRSVYVHRYVYWLFHNESPAVVRHKCDNPGCFNIEHLDGGSVQDNIKDMVDRGRCVRPGGAAHYKSRLSEAEVTNIRQRYAKGERVTDLADEYQYSARGIYNILQCVTHKKTEQV